MKSFVKLVSWGMVVDMADDGREGLGSCYQICIRTLLMGTN